MNKIFSLVLLSLLSLTISCRSLSQTDSQSISSINIIDRNGMTETISTKERLAQFNKMDFLAPQPYQKILRVYEKDKAGNRRSSITSYHPNGSLKQSLEAVNNRAYGPYLEYYANGQKKIESFVIGGVADINTQSEMSWLFDGISYAWDESGNLLAEIYYDKGVLEGVSHYYHSNGKIWKRLPYKNNQLEGELSIYLNEGSLLQKQNYVGGILQGTSVRFWDNDKISFKEEYRQGKLMEGSYYSKEGILISNISQGKGFRAIFGKEHLEELHEYKEGVQEGLVKIFDEHSHLVRLYSIHDNEKEGEEYDYYPSSTEKLYPKLMISWKEGMIQGVVQTWYPNGQLESRREISQNKKNGFSTSWYRNGSIMCVEEYDNDILLKGEYYRMNEKEPASIVKKGQGIALLFDSEGVLSQKITYQEGKPS